MSIPPPPFSLLSPIFHPKKLPKNSEMTSHHQSKVHHNVEPTANHQAGTYWLSIRTFQLYCDTAPLWQEAAPLMQHQENKTLSLQSLRQG
jgi:hypothetical protein